MANKFNLPTAAEVTKLPIEFRQAIARKNRTKGSNYERDVAKKIATYFGEKWDDCFYRTKPHGHAQPDGDLKPVNEMWVRWKGAKLGPLECKNRSNWTFDQIFKHPQNSELYRYWKKSNEDTKSDNTIVVFTKSGVQDYVMCLSYNLPSNNFVHLVYFVGDDRFYILSLKDFLNTIWSK